MTKVETGIDVGAGLDMALANAMRTQRAIRRLRPDPVEDATILQLLELALKAPTGGNRQPVEFVVVRDPDVLHQLARLNRQAWAVYRRLGINRRRRNDERARRIVDAVKWQADHFEETPAVVVVCLRGRSPWDFPRSSLRRTTAPATPPLRTSCWRRGPSASARPSRPSRSGRPPWPGAPSGCPATSLRSRSCRWAGRRSRTGRPPAVQSEKWCISTDMGTNRSDSERHQPVAVRHHGGVPAHAWAARRWESSDRRVTASDIRSARPTGDEGQPSLQGHQSKAGDTCREKDAPDGSVRHASSSRDSTTGCSAKEAEPSQTSSSTPKPDDDEWDDDEERGDDPLDDDPLLEDSDDRQMS